MKFKYGLYWHNTNELVFSKSYKFACVPIEDSDKPAHACSLISLDGRSMGSLGSNISSPFLQAEN